MFESISLSPFSPQNKSKWCFEWALAFCMQVGAQIRLKYVAFTVTVTQWRYTVSTRLNRSRAIGSARCQLHYLQRIIYDTNLIRDILWWKVIDQGIYLLHDLRLDVALMFVSFWPVTFICRDICGGVRWPWPVFTSVLTLHQEDEIRCWFGQCASVGPNLVNFIDF